MQAANPFLAFRWLGGPEGKSVVAEVYPSLWTRRFPREDREGDEQAAYAVAAWLQRADLNGSLGSFFNPPLTSEERRVADAEGWILRVVRTGWPVAH